MSQEEEKQFENVVFDGFDLADENLQGWDGEGGGPPAIPPGIYTLEVANVEIADTNAGDGRNFVFTWRVADEGEYQGKEFKSWMLFAGKNLKDGHRRRIAHVIRDCLRAPLNAAGGFETKDLLGLRLTATISHETYAKRNPLTQEIKEYINLQMNGERPVEGAAPAQAAAPAKPAGAPPKPTAPPSKPPAAPPRAPAAAPARRA